MKAWLGDPSDPSLEHDTKVTGAISVAHTALRNGVETITALTGDMTRSDPEKHAVGGEVSARTVAKLDEVQRTLTAKANAYTKAADEALKERFTLKAEDGWTNNKWCDFIREQAAVEGGYGVISETMLQHRDLATLIIKMPSVLLGIPPRQHEIWRVKAVEKFEPEIQAAAQMGADIREIASRYVRVIGLVKTNFHTPAIAAKVATRVKLT